MDADAVGRRNDKPPTDEERKRMTGISCSMSFMDTSLCPHCLECPSGHEPREKK